MRKLVYLLLSFVIALAPISSYALVPPPKLDVHDVKNIKKVKGALQADVIFKYAEKDAYYAVRNKSIAVRSLGKVAKKRLLCRTPVAGLFCKAVTEVAYTYFSEELGLRDFNYNADTGEFKTPYPSRYKFEFGNSLAGFHPSVDAFLAAYAADTGQKSEMGAAARANVERKISEIDFSKLRFTPPSSDPTVPKPWAVIDAGYFQFGDSYPSPRPFSIKVSDYALTGVAYAPDGTPTTVGERTLTGSEVDALLDIAIQNAPDRIIKDLMTSPDYVLEGHQPLIDASKESRPFDPELDDFILDPDPDKYPDPDQTLEPAPDPDTGTGTNPDTGTGTGNGFTLPSFCTWAKPVCDLAQFFTKEPESNPETPVDVEDTPILQTPESFDKSYLNFGGQCPSLPSFNITVGAVVTPMSFDLNPLCDLAVTIRPAIVAIGYFVALGLIVAAIRET